MNKIQFFYDDDLIGLQAKVNEWLYAHAEIKILSTNLTSFGKPSQRAGIVNTEKHVFYILYVTAQWENIIMEQKAEQTTSSEVSMEQNLKLDPELPN